MVDDNRFFIISPATRNKEYFNWFSCRSGEIKDENYEVVEIIRYVVADIEELARDVTLTSALNDVDRSSFSSISKLCDQYNESILSMWKFHDERNTLPLFYNKRASHDHIQFILSQCYNRAVSEPDKLNQYPPFSPQVYGETSFELINQMISTIQIKSEDIFIDLGSGVGQVVLQLSASSDAKICYGIEKAEYPALCASNMSSAFKHWMEFYGKSYSPYVLERGDFLTSEYQEKITSATVLFANNFAFGPEVDHQLKQRFANLKEGARIISSKAFCPLNFRITDRNLGDIGSIIHVKCLNPIQDAVSWTDKPFSYYVHTIDRSLLEQYFARLKNPKAKIEGQIVRRDRKGRIISEPGQKESLPNGICRSKVISNVASGEHTTATSKRSASLVDKSRPRSRCLLSTTSKTSSSTATTKSTLVISSSAHCRSHLSQSHSSCPNLTLDDSVKGARKTAKCRPAKVDDGMSCSADSINSSSTPSSTSSMFSLLSSSSSSSASAASSSSQSSANRSPSTNDESTLVGATDHDKTVVFEDDKGSETHSSGIRMKFKLSNGYHHLTTTPIENPSLNGDCTAEAESSVANRRVMRKCRQSIEENKSTAVPNSPINRRLPHETRMRRSYCWQRQRKAHEQQSRRRHRTTAAAKTTGLANKHNLDVLHGVTLDRIRRQADQTVNDANLIGLTQHYHKSVDVYSIRDVDLPRIEVESTDYKTGHNNHPIPLVLTQYLELTKQVFMDHFAMMRSSHYSAAIRAQLEKEQLRHEQLLKHTQKLEKSIEKLHAEGVQFLNRFTKNLGILITTPTAFFAQARRLIKHHHVLEEKIAEFRKQISQLSHANQDLVRRHQLEASRLLAQARFQSASTATTAAATSTSVRLATDLSAIGTNLPPSLEKVTAPNKIVDCPTTSNTVVPTAAQSSVQRCRVQTDDDIPPPPPLVRMYQASPNTTAKLPSLVRELSLSDFSTTIASMTDSRRTFLPPRKRHRIDVASIMDVGIGAGDDSNQSDSFVTIAKSSRTTAMSSVNLSPPTLSPIHLTDETDSFQTLKSNTTTPPTTIPTMNHHSNAGLYTKCSDNYSHNVMISPGRPPPLLSSNRPGDDSPPPVILPCVQTH